MKCKHNRIEIVSTITFGHGDSSTKTVANCLECGESGKTYYDYGFPSRYETIRKAQFNLVKDGE